MVWALETIEEDRTEEASFRPKIEREKQRNEKSGD
jgi:hypothetical protein